MATPAASLSAWVDALFGEVEARGDDLLSFDLIGALVACGPPPAVEAWVARLPVALSRSVLWADIADARRARGEAPEAVAAAVELAATAALASRHPLPAIDLLRRWGAGAVPAARAHVERFAVHPGEWFLGAHAVLADALATEDPAAAERHLEVALRPRPTFPASVAKHESALEAVVCAASLARRLTALGRAAEAETQRRRALDRFARGLRSGDFEDRHAHFDLAEEDGIGDLAAVRRAVFELVFGALAPGEIEPMRAAGHDILAGGLAAAGRLDEARALAEGEVDAGAAIVWAAIAASARDAKEAAAALAEARRVGTPADVLERYEEGIFSAEDRFGILCGLGRAHGRLGRSAEGLAILRPLIDEAREAWPSGLREVREALSAAKRDATVAPWRIVAPMTDRQIERARKRPENIRPPRLLDAAASRPGADGAALLDEALACRADTDLETREGSWPESWLAAYAVHGRLDGARRVADRMHADLAYRGRVAMEGMAAFVLALDACGRQDEAARELARWLDLPVDAPLLAAVFAVAAQHGALRDLAERAAAALGRIDARVDAYRL